MSADGDDVTSNLYKEPGQGGTIGWGEREREREKSKSTTMGRRFPFPSRPAMRTTIPCGKHARSARQAALSTAGSRGLAIQRVYQGLKDVC